MFGVCDFYQSVVPSGMLPIMPRTLPTRTQTAAFQLAWRNFRRLPRRYQFAVGALVVVAGLLYLFVLNRPASVHPSPNPSTVEEEAAPAPDPSFQRPVADGYLFCFWNVENLFDDKVDAGRRSVDKAFDEGFGENTELRERKYDRIASALLRMNGGRGPDILAFAEVENVRAADLLRGALNAKLTASRADPKLQYTQVAMKNLGNDAGRHIGTGVLTRLPVNHARTRLHGHNQRILEVHLPMNGHDLTVIASHWTSQLKQRDGSDGDAGRDKYARTIYEAYRQAAVRDATVDFLVCGDFNCTPEDSSVTQVLGAFNDRAKLNGPPAFLNLLAGKSPAQFGTIFYSGRPLIYDQICVSPGMLDQVGWSCDPAGVRVETEGLMRRGGTRREPWRFGDPGREPFGERGYSDHFPVTVRLRAR